MKKNQNLIIVMVLYFLMNVFNNLGHPVTPSYVRYLNIPEYMFGVFYATMSFGMMFAAPAWGSLGDTKKNKYLITAGLLIYAIAQIGFGLSHNQYLMVFFRLIGGIGIAAPMTLFVSLAIGFSGGNRIRNLAIMAALSTLGASLGYQIGGVLGDSEAFKNIIKTPSYENIFIFQVVCMVLLATLVLLFIKDYEKKFVVSSRKNPFATLGKIKTLDTKLILFLVSLTLITMGSTNLSKYIDVYFNDLSLSTTALGNFVLVTGIISVLTSILIVPFVSKFKKQLWLIIIMQVLSSMIVFYVFRADKFLLTIYTVYNVYVIFRAVYLPLEQNYISKNADQESLGIITGIRQSFVSVGNVIGPLFGGVLYSISPLLLFDVSGYLFLVGALLLVIIVIIQKKEFKTDES